MIDANRPESVTNYVTPSEFAVVLQRATLPGKGELIVQLLDGRGLAPWLQVETEPAYIPEVRRDLLAGSKVQGLASKATRLIDVALPDVGGGQRSHQPRAGLDDLGVQRRKG
jgi:hypothetical protein